MTFVASKPVKFEDYPEEVKRFVYRLISGTDSKTSDYDVAYYGENIVIAKYKGGTYWVRDRHYCNPKVEVYYLKRGTGGINRCESKTLLEIGKDHEVKRFVGKPRHDLLAEAPTMDANEGVYLEDKARAEADHEAHKATQIEKAQGRVDRLVDDIQLQGWEHDPHTYNQGMKSERTSTLDDDKKVEWHDGGMHKGLYVSVDFTHPNGSTAHITIKDGEVQARVSLPVTGSLTARAVFNHAADYQAPGRPAF